MQGNLRDDLEFFVSWAHGLKKLFLVDIVTDGPVIKKTCYLQLMKNKLHKLPYKERHARYIRLGGSGDKTKTPIISIFWFKSLILEKICPLCAHWVSLWNVFWQCFSSIIYSVTICTWNYTSKYLCSVDLTR
jgi:hypothetical protein